MEFKSSQIVKVITFKYKICNITFNMSVRYAIRFIFCIKMA